MANKKLLDISLVAGAESADYLYGVRASGTTPVDVRLKVDHVAQLTIDRHVNSTNPHPNYITTAAGSATFVLQSSVNQPFGVAPLDNQGLVPVAKLPNLPAGRKITVANAAARLTLPQYSDITIAYQADDASTWSLDANADPSISGNWTQLGSAVAAGVASFNSRTGNVTPGAGDYTADQITETTRKFVSTAEKNTWNSKQDALVSGTNLRTIGGQSLLGSGDIAIPLTSVTSVNGYTGVVSLTYTDVGAEQQGSLASHIAAADPHTQYLTQTRGDLRYIQNSKIGSPNGVPSLDSSGLVPTSMLPNLATGRKIVVADATARLALSSYPDITIAYQANDGTSWALDANADPSISGNWTQLGSAVAAGVASFNSRTGNVTPSTGDYTADQITETTRKFVSTTEKNTWNSKQDALVSGTNIKTIGGQSLLGSGDISANLGVITSVNGYTGTVVLTKADIGLSDVDNTSDLNKPVSTATQTALNTKQDTLVSGTNIKTISNQSLVGSGDITFKTIGGQSIIGTGDISAQLGTVSSVNGYTGTVVLTKADVNLSNVDNTSDLNKPVSTATQTALNAKQATLVSGTNIKTINGNSLLGGGDITISAGAGSSGYTVQYVTGATANQVFSFNLPTTQTSYSYNAYALKEEAGLTSQTSSFETFDLTSSSKYTQTSALVWSGVVAPYTGQQYTTTTDGSFYSASIKADGASVAVVSSSTTSIVPLMTSNTTPSGYTASASAVDGGALPYLAFDGVIGSNIWGCAGVGWLRIDLPTTQSIISYSITNRGVSPYSVFNPISWTFEGSNDSGSTWSVLHTVSNDNNSNPDAVRTYTLSSVATYKSYRINVSLSNGSYTVIAEMKLFPPTNSLLIYGADTNWYTASGGTITQVSAPVTSSDFTTSGFTSSGTLLNSALSAILPIKVFSGTSGLFLTTYTPTTQIALQTTLAKMSSYSAVNSATLTATQANNGKVRVAVSRDLTNWLAWNGTSWANLGSLTASTASATTLLNSGMTPAVLNAVTSLQWASFYSAAPGGLPDYLAVAYALDLPNPTSDVANIDLLNLNVNYVSAQKLQTPAEVEIRWYKDQVTFKTINAGNYRLAYQTPSV